MDYAFVDYSRNCSAVRSVGNISRAAFETRCRRGSRAAAIERERERESSHLERGFGHVVREVAGGHGVCVCVCVCVCACVCVCVCVCEREREREDLECGFRHVVREVAGRHGVCVCVCERERERESARERKRKRELAPSARISSRGTRGCRAASFPVAF